MASIYNSNSFKLNLNYILKSKLNLRGLQALVLVISSIKVKK